MPNPVRNRPYRTLCVVGLFVAISFAESRFRNAQAQDAASVKAFESDVRPILSRHCIRCHQEKTRKGGLDLTSAATMLKGGDTGPAIVPGNAAESLMVEAIGYDTDLRMPPRGRLSDDEISRLKAWIDRGAVWPKGEKLIVPADSPEVAESAGHTGPRLRKAPFTLTDEDRNWWSLKPVVDPPLPNSISKDLTGNSIDAFLMDKLQAKGLRFLPEASKRELIRRVSYDLLGLPPTPEEVAAFETDERPDAWERLVDRLLASPHYGERWGRHWLDLVRFAETNGYERDGDKPNAWRYRDYVISSFNSDKPYNQFLREQLAGDEMPGPFDADRIVATGYFRLHVWDDEPDSTVAAEYDDLDDIMVTTGASMLGLTLGCARCHDHKYDPISQEDYYRFLSYFRSIDGYGLQKTGGGGRGTGRITAPLADAATVARWERTKAVEVEAKKKAFSLSKDDAERKKLAVEIQRLESGADAPFGTALAVYEDAIKPTHVLRRGDAHSPTVEVGPGIPPVFGSSGPQIEKPANGNSSGRRTALADWITDPANPLTARVFVNRLWQHHFGRGIVPTPDDFGRTGEPPTHPELLDHLAADFISGGWRMKRMHKRILMSRAYRMSSRADDPAGIKADEANALFWRQNPKRLEAEALRDSILAVTGSLNSKMGGPGVYARLPAEVFETADGARRNWPVSPLEEQNRRSVYLFVKRSMTVPLMEIFDSPSTTVPVGRRNVTTVAPQALTLLHDEFVHDQAKRLARTVTETAGPGSEERSIAVFRKVLQRRPTEEELRLSVRFLANAGRSAGESNEFDQLVLFCAAVLNLNEVIYVD
ncbi:DUF1553 domain-containing protein [bacterium]|nr:DUF1553 domain-containing protein [bacterium]